MADFHIYVGYRTVSSWSLRGWLPMKKAGVPFEETLIRYRTPEGRAELDRLSPTGKVPFLVHTRSDGSDGQGVGFVGDRRISGRDRAAGAAVARGPGRPGTRPLDRGGDAFQLRGAPPAFRYGTV